jgi:hypothetical protein
MIRYRPASTAPGANLPPDARAEEPTFPTRGGIAWRGDAVVCRSDALSSGCPHPEQYRLPGRLSAAHV